MADCVESGSAELPELIVIRWNGQEFKVSGLSGAATIGDLKTAISALTGVRPDRQKLFGLKHAGMPANSDDLKLVDLQITSTTKIMMVGTREEELVKAIEPPAELPEVLNDFDVEEEEVLVQDRAEYLVKVEKRIKTYEFKVLSQPRDGTKLLVLDVDYTIFDHKSVAESGRELMRPYLHEFLETAYSSNYDIVIWSATGMKWIEAKMHEIGITRNPTYSICFLMDSGAMITVQVETYGVIEVKPLGVIWGRFPQWNKTNTVMFDDLRRNFLMNPQNGLKIRPFKEAHFNRGTDKELKKLAKYLTYIAKLDDFSSLDHRHWERYCRNHKRSKRQRHDDTDTAT